MILNQYIDNFGHQCAEESFFLGFSIDYAISNEIIQYILNAFKQLRYKKKQLTVIVGNFNNYNGYSDLSGKSDPIESDFGFFIIDGIKIIFKWLKDPSRYIYIDLRDLSLHFEDITVISGTTHDPYDSDDSKILNILH
jgi:hypothetical protein